MLTELKKLAQELQEQIDIDSLFKKIDAIIKQLGKSYPDEAILQRNNHLIFVFGPIKIVWTEGQGKWFNGNSDGAWFVSAEITIDNKKYKVQLTPGQGKGGHSFLVDAKLIDSSGNEMGPLPESLSKFITDSDPWDSDLYKDPEEFAKMLIDAASGLKNYHRLREKSGVSLEEDINAQWFEDQDEIDDEDSDEDIILFNAKYLICTKKYKSEDDFDAIYDKLVSGWILRPQTTTEQGKKVKERVRKLVTDPIEAEKIREKCKPF